MSAVSIPVAVFMVAFFVIYSLLARQIDGLHIGLFVAVMAVLILATVLTSTGTPFALDILLVSFAPWIVVIGYVTVGHRHVQAHLAGLEASVRH